ncbi:hypothetical protein [Terrimonas pollutisoli]|uniref:hypothetical protein n=1 Tax=Terrimonas pollutisoli TaxID=3034147 RepID=UPI0023EB4345|nr:hypothetical protein [Terrimonas sp. H1YJ31]
MGWLLFLSRLAFICGLCFLASLAFLVRREGNTEVVSSTIITIGFVMGLLIVPATLVCYLIVLVRKKQIPVPLWLIIANIVFLFILMLYIIFINVEGNYPS